MRFSLALILGLLVVSAFAQDVVVLNSDNFDDIVTSHDLVLVEFFAPWCGHCKQLAPKFATAAETLAAEGITNAILASVDCTIETDLASRYKIEGYPTLLAFKKDTNNGTPYNGAREVDALVSYIKKKSAPAVSSVATVADLDALASKGGSIVLFGGSADDVSAFTSAADADEAHSYFHVSDESVIAASRTTAPAIKLFRSFSDTPAVLSEFPVTAAAIAEFVDANGYPLVSEINQDSYQRLAKKPHPLMILVLDTEVDTKDGFLATWNTLAAEFPSLSFTYGPSAQLINAVKQFGGTGNVLPSIIGFRVPGMADVESSLPDRFAWPESEAFSESTARAWLTTVVAGSPAVHKKSEPIPADNSAPVKILVADNFSELVVNSNKYVLVKFYAPWCGHCKNLAPIYDELAEKLVGQDTIVIGKMDATENWVDPTFNVQGFPTIYLVTPNKAAHILFDGERTVDGFLQFLEQHTGLSLGGGGGGSDDKAAHDEL